MAKQKSPVAVKRQTVAPIGPPLTAAPATSPVQVAIEAGEAQALGQEQSLLRERQVRLDDLNDRKAELQRQMDQLDVDIKNVEGSLDDPIEAVVRVPKCIPQFDHTLRSPRTTFEANKMIEVSNSDESVIEELTDPVVLERRDRVAQQLEGSSSSDDDQGLLDDLITSGMNVPEALTVIAECENEDELQAVVDHEERSTLTEAASKKLKALQEEE